MPVAKRPRGCPADRHAADLSRPCGHAQAMTFALWTPPTPNGWKVSILVEELIEAGHDLSQLEVHTVRLGRRAVRRRVHRPQSEPEDPRAPGRRSLHSEAARSCSTSPRSTRVNCYPTARHAGTCCPGFGGRPRTSGRCSATSSATRAISIRCRPKPGPIRSSASATRHAD